MGRIRQVRRDDGTLVPFRERKVSDAVHEALRIAGTEDPALADELAGVVMLFLEKYHGESVPSVRDVDEMLFRVLQETGHTRAASIFEELQRERRRLQEELTVRAPRTASSGVPPPEGGEEVRPWDRTRLVNRLVEKRELPESVAEELAASVEQRLMRSGLKSITTTLLSELVDYELIDRGLDGAGGMDRVPGLRRSDLVRLLQSDDEGPELPDRRIAAEAFSRYALTEIHGEATARAHREGRIHVSGLEDPLRVERVTVPASLLLPPGSARDAARDLLHLRTVLDGLRDHVRSEIVLSDLAGAIALGGEAGEDPARLAALVLMALDFRDAYGQVRPPRPHLVIPLEAPADAPAGTARFIDALLDAALAAPECGQRLAVTLAAGEGRDGDDDGAADGRLARILALAAVRPATVFTLPRAGDPPTFPGPRIVPAPLRVSLGRVAINLPLALLEAHGNDLNDALPKLEEAGRWALAAFTERFWNQRQGGRQGLHGVVVRLGGPGQVQVAAQDQEVDVEIWGLSHALEILVRRGFIRRPERPRAAARLLGYLDYLLGEEKGGVRFRVRLGGTDCRDVRRRFLEALESHAARYGVQDVLDLLREGPPERSTLPVVVPLFSETNAPLTGAPFAERLAPGLALPLAAFGESSPSRLLARLRSETRLGLLTLAPRRPGDDVFEVQEELF